MKNILLPISLIVIFMNSALLALPKLEIQPKEFSFGMIPQNSTVVHKFWFKSVGDDTLKISEIKTGCSCAIMPLKQDFILPGDSMEVQFLWDVGKRVYQIGRYPYIFTNASDEPYRMSLTGEVHKTLDSSKPVSVSPYKCEFSIIRDKSINEVEITFTNQTDKDIHVILLTPSVEECNIEMPQVISAHSKAVGKISVKNDFLDKEFVGSITLLLDDKKETRISIPYRRKIYQK